MTGILSLTTFTPLVGVAAILLLRAFRTSEDAKAVNAVKWIAFVTTLATFAFSLLLVAQYDPANPGFQFLEDHAWFAGLHYRMGVDGISILFVLLTAFLMPICIAASWNSIEKPNA